MFQFHKAFTFQHNSTCTKKTERCRNLQSSFYCKETFCKTMQSTYCLYTSASKSTNTKFHISWHCHLIMFLSGDFSKQPNIRYQISMHLKNYSKNIARNFAILIQFKNMLCLFLYLFSTFSTATKKICYDCHLLVTPFS